MPRVASGKPCYSCGCTKSLSPTTGHQNWSYNHDSEDNRICEVCCQKIIRKHYHLEYTRHYLKNEKNRQRMRVYNKLKRREDHAELVRILGSRCSSSECHVPGGMDDFRALDIDHINGGGNLERTVTFTNHNNMYRYYIAHPDEAKQKLQILCANCNRIKKIVNNEIPYSHREVPESVASL